MGSEDVWERCPSQHLRRRRGGAKCVGKAAERDNLDADDESFGRAFCYIFCNHTYSLERQIRLQIGQRILRISSHSSRKSCSRTKPIIRVQKSAPYKYELVKAAGACKSLNPLVPNRNFDDLVKYVEVQELNTTREAMMRLLRS